MHAEIGSIIHLTDNLHAGVHVYNLLNSKLKNEMSRKLPAIYTLGLGYELSESIYMSAEVAKEEGQPVNMNIAVHYSLVKQLFLRGGIATGSNQFFWNRNEMEKCQDGRSWNLSSTVRSNTFVTAHFQ